MIQSIDTKIVGVTFEGRQSVCERLFPGARLMLVREPENAHDPNAVSVLFEGQKCGYLSKTLAINLAPLMDSGVELEAVVRSLCGGGDLYIGVNITIQETSKSHENERQEQNFEIGSPFQGFQKKQEVTDTLYEGGEKVTEHPVEEHFINHLEFMGYTVTETSINEDQKFYQCSHPIKTDLFLIPMEQLSAIMLRTHWNLEEDTVSQKRTELLKRINSLNTSLLFACCFLSDDNQLIIEAALLKQYERISFGIFIEYFLEEIKKIQMSIVEVIETNTVNTEFTEKGECGGSTIGDYDENYNSEWTDEDHEEEYFDTTDCSSCPNASGDSPESCEQCADRGGHPSGNWDDDREILADF